MKRRKALDTRVLWSLVVVGTVLAIIVVAIVYNLNHAANVKQALPEPMAAQPQADESTRASFDEALTGWLAVAAIAAPFVLLFKLPRFIGWQLMGGFCVICGGLSLAMGIGSGDGLLPNYFRMAMVWGGAVIYLLAKIAALLSEQRKMD